MKFWQSLKDRFIGGPGIPTPEDLAREQDRMMRETHAAKERRLRIERRVTALDAEVRAIRRQDR
jgi:hypothetical protein